MYLSAPPHTHSLLHDALPIYAYHGARARRDFAGSDRPGRSHRRWRELSEDGAAGVGLCDRRRGRACDESSRQAELRSEEHTSELQSLTNLVCRLLLEKKKKKT